MKLSDRMKQYEHITAGMTLIPNLPVIARIDGRAFHTWTRGMNKPYDTRLQNLFDETTKFLIEQTNAIIGYTQSDEINLIIWNYAKVDSDVLFSGKIAKLNSVLASLTTAFFNTESVKVFFNNKLAFFDCRVWNVPTPEEAVNCLIWREQDAVRNSVQMLAQSYYSQNQLHGKNNADMQDMIHAKGDNWNNHPARFKRGGYFRRELFERQFTPEELAILPEHHEAKKNPEMLIKRHRIVEVELPVLTKIINRIDVVFHQETPELGKSKPLNY